MFMTLMFVNRNIRFVAKKQSTQYTEYNGFHSKITYVETTSKKTNNKMKDFCVFSQKCKIPRLDPFSIDSMRLFKPTEFKECSNQPDLVTVLYDTQRSRYRLHINEYLPELIPNISSYGCTYIEISRGQNDSVVW